MTFPHLNGRAEKLADSLDLPAELAEWLAVSALHSGCFLRSQLQFFCGHDKDDRMSTLRIIRRLTAKQLITETLVGSLGLLARVTNKTVYRLIEADNISYRRLASFHVEYGTTPPDILSGSSPTSTRSPSIPLPSRPTSSIPTPRRRHRRESAAGAANTQLFGPIYTASALTFISFMPAPTLGSKRV